MAVRAGGVEVITLPVIMTTPFRALEDEASGRRLDAASTGRSAGVRLDTLQILSCMNPNRPSRPG